MLRKCSIGEKSDDLAGHESVLTERRQSRDVRVGLWLYAFVKQRLIETTGPGLCRPERRQSSASRVKRDPLLNTAMPV
ncbi:hypothetical protein TNCV_3355411 [Trichonephila clavipes]|nr:hypothetical protein TNCV_3355411 [Trichonephila clavipes]